MSDVKTPGRAAEPRRAASQVPASDAIASELNELLDELRARPAPAAPEYPGFAAMADQELIDVIADPFALPGEEAAAIVDEASRELVRRLDGDGDGDGDDDDDDDGGDRTAAIGDRRRRRPCRAGGVFQNAEPTPRKNEIG